MNGKSSCILFDQAELSWNITSNTTKYKITGTADLQLLPSDKVTLQTDNYLARFKADDKREVVQMLFC